MKYAINALEAVRSFYADKGIKIRIRYYNEGKEVSKAEASEFTVSGTDVEFVAETQPADMTVEELAAELQEFAPEVVEAPVEAVQAEEAAEASAEAPAEEQAAETLVEAVTPAKARKPRTESKAYALREFIRQAKEAGEYDYEATVDWTQDTLGFKRPLARVYVRIAAERVDASVEAPVVAEAAQPELA